MGISICDNSWYMHPTPENRTDSASLAARDLRVVWHPCTQMKDHETLPMIAVRRGSGAWLEDFEASVISMR